MFCDLLFFCDCGWKKLNHTFKMVLWIYKTDTINTYQLTRNIHYKLEKGTYFYNDSYLMRENVKQSGIILESWNRRKIPTKKSRRKTRLFYGYEKRGKGDSIVMMLIWVELKCFFVWFIVIVTRVKQHISFFLYRMTGSIIVI